MIFAGDVAIAGGDQFSFLDFPSSLGRHSWCLNLEGAIVTSNMIPTWGVCNSIDWVDSFRNIELGPVFVGNNHIHDVPNGIVGTNRHLEELGIAYFGAGINKVEAARPLCWQSQGIEYVLLGFGWSVIGCVAARSCQPGVNRFEGQRIKQQFDKAQNDYPNARIVVVVHNNYEFERYPQPGHRKLALELIDRGAYAVIGHHPHIVGPIERYKGRTIAYSLGNWAFSYGRFFGGRLFFPPSSFPQIALELGEEEDTVHHALFVPPTTIAYQSSELVGDPQLTIKALFEGMSHEEYVRWFKAHRLKRKGLPVYFDAEEALGNSMRDIWVWMRQVLIDFAAKHRLKAIRRAQ